MENTHNFFSPPFSLIGVGSIKDLPTYIMHHKLKKVLIVTDKNIISCGYVEMVETILKSLFISFDIFDGILHPNATISFVEDGLAYFDTGIDMIKRNYSLIISVGGGTCHDCAKAISILATNGGSIEDYEGYNKMTKPALPTICINTTSGSSSELVNYTIITDETRKVKMTIGDYRMMPIISVNDPMFMTTMPLEITAACGLDVFSHAIEAFVTTETSPITDNLALGAMKGVFRYLRHAYENGNNLEAREQMMFADCMAGMAFNSAGLGYVHAMSHQIGGVYNQIHGIINSVLIPHVLNFNAPSIPHERIFSICEAIGIKAKDKSDAVDKIMSSVQKLCEDVGLPNHLAALGVKDEDLEFMAKNAEKDICSLTNPRKGTFVDIVNIFKDAM